jgi:hypothetical protein
MGSDNKVRELATVCFQWQQWTETSVCFDDVGISAFHSCVVVDLWQSLSEWRLLLYECVLVCRRENVGTNIKFVFKLGKSGSEIREVLVQVYRDNAMKKIVYKWLSCFSEGRESVTDEEKVGRPATSRTEENIAKVRKIVRENYQMTNRSINSKMCIISLTWNPRSTAKMTLAPR